MMAPKQDFVYITYDKDEDGDVNFAQACFKEEAANAVAETMRMDGKTNVEVRKIALVDGEDSGKKGGKGKGTTASKKGKEKAETKNLEGPVDEDEDEDEGEGTEEASPKPTKAPKKSSSKAIDDAKAARKTVPEGQPGSLKGLKLLFTGTMSMDRSTADATAVKYGAEIVKKLEETDYIILGAKPGPKKIAEIEEKNLKTITEDEFLEMIKGGDEPAKKKQKK